MSQEPITMSSRMPGDAVASTPQPQPQPGPAKTVILTSVHPTDPSKQRAFEYRYYAAPSSSSQGPSALSRSLLDLPESYFSPTPSELQHAHHSHVKRTHDLVDRPLLTQKLRDQQLRQHERDRAQRWPLTRIRVRWPDRSLLEGVFPSSDKLVHLYEFVRLALADDVRDCPFVLYQSPPRTEYRRSAPHLKGKSLLDLHLAPSSALYLKFEPSPSLGFPPARVDALNDPARGPPLVEALRSAVAVLPPPLTFDPRGEGGGEGEGEGDEARRKRDKEDRIRRLLSGGGGKGGAGGVAPSWMKLGKDAHKK
ncbi:hypothetical protein DMC30DRAFT_417667 [Rhodotorula diobovata]|uniref:UBX domain-containing protein n=1 Tax=Rhodotorula diobovata TaxID=5288 RepID=A0A5C5FTM5_9BASI|nr:hypothetical protein DMC30DRAFT_417667 [Rhodotorula diobovata]